MSQDVAKRLSEKPSFSSFVIQNNEKVGCFSKNGDFYTLSGYSSDDLKEEICDEDYSIVAYQENWIYYAQGIIYIVLLVMLWSILVQFMYYKVFLFVLLGSQKK